MPQMFEPYDADDGYMHVPAPQHYGTNSDPDPRGSSGRHSDRFGQSQSGYYGQPFNGGTSMPEPSGRASGWSQEQQYGYPLPEPYNVTQAHSLYSDPQVGRNASEHRDNRVHDVHGPYEAYGGTAEAPIVGDNGPTWAGAFTNLIQRMTPVEDVPVEKAEHPMGRLGTDFGRERHAVEDGSTVQQSPPVSTWSPWQSPRQGHVDEMLNQSPPPASDTSQGWSYGGWGWNSLFGTDANTTATQHEQTTTHANEFEMAPKMSVNDGAFMADRVGPPVVVDSTNRSPYDDYDRYRWPARNPDDIGYGGDVYNSNKPNKYDEWRGHFNNKYNSAKANMPKMPENWREVDWREGCRVAGICCLNCTSRYTAMGPGQCPGICASIYLFIIGLIVIIGIAVAPMEIETDFDAFMKTDVNSSVLRDTFKAAKSSRTVGRRLQTPLFMQNDIYIGYELSEDAQGSIFSHSVMAGVASFERELLALPGWSTVCNKAISDVTSADLARLCNPGVSLVNFALPSLAINMTQSIIPSLMTFDGSGRDLVPMNTILRLVQNEGLQPVVLPIGFTEAEASKTRMFRSVFRFKQYCCTSATPTSERRPVIDRVKEEWDELLKETILPFLQEAADKKRAEKAGFRIFFGGSGVRDVEVKQTLTSDLWLAAGSMAFVLFYMLFHTQSLFLSFASLIIIFLVVPLSYVVFATFAGTRTMNIASFLSLFLVIGLGSDVVFVYTDFWRDALRYKDNEIEQLTYTLQQGGKASLATTATTALSFFANLASVLRPLREFGFFMGLCVSLCWVVISFVFVPLCAVDTKWCGRCSFLRRSRKKETSWQRNFGKLAICVHAWRKVLLAVCVLWILGTIISSAVLAETDSGVPNIFPKDHNQNRGKELLEKFSTISEVMDPLFNPPKTAEDICHEYSFNSNDLTNCSLFWCEVEVSIPKSTVDDCRCYRKLRGSCGGGVGTVVMRAIGIDNLPTLTSNNHISANLPVGVSISSTQEQAMAPINLEEWESGQSVLMPMRQASAQLQTSAYCGWDELCFCNTHICKLPAGWTSSVTLQLNGSTSSRLLQVSPSWTVPLSERASVNVVFGIDVKLESPLLGELEPSDMWSFSSRFDMSQPWSQRNIYEMCSTPPGNLKVASTNCWLVDFRQWLLSRGDRFPLQKDRFQPLVTQFLVSGLTNLRSSSDFLWLRSGVIKACYVDFFVDVHRHEPSEKAIHYMSNWNSYMTTWNDEASRATRGAWHTSQLWVRSEAQEELIASTITTLLVVMILAFVGMLLFTWDFLLSIYVVLATVIVLVGLAFFIIVMMSWKIGPIEVIALIVFLGYAVTYSLHIAHKYGCSEALENPPRLDLDESSATRFQRTQYALKSIGSAALGSAATTMGCSVFLLFCTLTIFQKLGGVVLVVTVLSITIAFFPLPALLLTFGPRRPGQYGWVLTYCRACTRYLRTLIINGGRREDKTSLALESYPSQRMVPDEDKRAAPGTLQLPAKQMHVRVLNSAQVPKPRGMRPSVESIPPLVLESNGDVKLSSGNNDSNVVHRGVVIGVNGKPISPASNQKGKIVAEMDDVHLFDKGFDIGEESRREPIQISRGEYNNSNANRQVERWRGVSPPRGNQNDSSNRFPLQSQNQMPMNSFNQSPLQSQSQQGVRGPNGYNTNGAPTFSVQGAPPTFSPTFGVQGVAGSNNAPRFGQMNNSRGPSPDSQKPPPNNKPTYSLASRRERFGNNRSTMTNAQNGFVPQGQQSLVPSNGYGPSNNAPWSRPPGQSVGRSTGREPSPLRGMRLPSAQ